MLQIIFKYKAKAYLIFWYAFLIFVHFVIKDRFTPLIFLFYACPLILIIIYGFLLSVGLYKHWKIAIVILCINIALVFHWVNNYHFKNETPVATTQSEDTHTVFYWNISRPDNLPLDIIVRMMETYHPEVIAFVEAKDIPKNDLRTFKRHYPDYDIQQLEGEMLIAVRGTVDSITFNRIEKGSHTNLIKTTIDNHGPTTILITDLLANPALSKEKDMTAVMNLTESNEIDFIVGDFNTPYESYYFNAFKTKFESFHNYNNGFSATWPSLLPLLEIDHFWLNRKWKPIALFKQFNSASDHGLLVGSYKLRQP